MKKILVPVDFSVYSEYALEAAVKIAQSQKTDVIALHMVGIPELLINKSDPIDAFEALDYSELVNKKFNEFLKKDPFSETRIEQLVCKFINFKEINDQAKRYKADLIVMGSHGCSGFSELFVGSNTEKIVRSSQVPVMVVKKRFENNELKDVIFACDFEKESIYAYTSAMKFFKKFKSKVHLLYINLPNEKFRNTAQIEEKVRQFFSMIHPPHNTAFDTINFVNDYSVEAGVYSFCKKMDADAISLATHGRQGLAHFFFGSVGEDLANHAELPVFTFRR